MLDTVLEKKYTLVVQYGAIQETKRETGQYATLEDFYRKLLIFVDTWKTGVVKNFEFGSPYLSFETHHRKNSTQNTFYSLMNFNQLPMNS